MEMDELNWAILACLQENARQSYAEIGRQVGLSAPAVAERVQRLEAEGIIEGYRPVLNVARLGYPLQAIISLKLHRGNLQAFLKKLPELKAVQECHRLTGNDCLSMKVAVQSPAKLEAFINLLMEYGDPTTSVLLSSPLNHQPVQKP